jgi:hypothetical protein
MPAKLTCLACTAASLQHTLTTSTTAQHMYSLGSAAAAPPTAQRARLLSCSDTIASLTGRACALVRCSLHRRAAHPKDPESCTGSSRHWHQVRFMRAHSSTDASRVQQAMQVHEQPHVFGLLVSDAGESAWQVLTRLGSCQPQCDTSGARMQC